MNCENCKREIKDGEVIYTQTYPTMMAEDVSYNDWVPVCLDCIPEWKKGNPRDLKPGIASISEDGKIGTVTGHKGKPIKAHGFSYGYLSCEQCREHSHFVSMDAIEIAVENWEEENEGKIANRRLMHDLLCYIENDFGEWLKDNIKSFFRDRYICRKCGTVQVDNEDDICPGCAISQSPPDESSLTRLDIEDIKEEIEGGEN